MTRLLIAKVERERARVSLTDDEGTPSQAYALTPERVRLALDGFAITVDGECDADPGNKGWLMALPISCNQGPHLSITVASDSGQAHITLDSKGIKLLVEHLTEAVRLIALELEADTGGDLHHDKKD